MGGGGRAYSAAGITKVCPGDVVSCKQQGATWRLRLSGIGFKQGSLHSKGAEAKPAMTGSEPWQGTATGVPLAFRTCGPRIQKRRCLQAYRAGLRVVADPAESKVGQLEVPAAAGSLGHV